LSGRVAKVIYERLVKAARGEVTPKNILRLTPEKLREIGLSKQKSAYIVDLATLTRAKKVVFETLDSLSDDEVIEHLTVVKGVGVWTAHMFLMFTLRRPDILPTGDFGIRMAMYKNYLEKRGKRNGAVVTIKVKKKSDQKPKKVKIILPTPEQMQKIAKRWEPYRSIACWYLWQSLDVKTIG
jgi:DNA-3-methyladenine glycosylase II